MNQQGWTHWTGRAVVVARDNIDTDQIYPGRFLSLTDRSEMSAAFFADWRFDEEGREKIDSPFSPGQSVFVAGENFGCGSSREHAVWVMRDFGFRVVLARSFAPIFKQNAIANGLAPIEISAEDYLAFVENPAGIFQVSIDLEKKQGEFLSVISKISKKFEFNLAPFDLHCLRSGVDSLGFLLSLVPRTNDYLTNKNKLHSLSVYSCGGK